MPTALFLADVLIDLAALNLPSGNAVLNGVPVTVSVGGVYPLESAG